MQYRPYTFLRIILLPLAAGVAFAQTPAVPSHPASPPAGQATPPASLREIFASPFASRLAAADTTTVSITPGGIVPVYSTNTTIQPGEWVSIYGNNLAPALATWNGDFPTSLGGTSVTFNVGNGEQGYLEFVSPTQINLQVPDFTPPVSGTVTVVVKNAKGSATSTVTLGQFGPSFLLLDSTHVAGIILRSDNSGAYGGGTYDIIGPTGSSLGYPTKAAKAGDSVVLFGVGFGPTNPPVTSGQPFSGAAPAANPVQLTINGTVLTFAPNGPNGPFTFAGLQGAGLFQFNVTLPAGLGTGDVPLVGMVGGVQTPSGVVISLQ